MSTVHLLPSTCGRSLNSQEKSFIGHYQNLKRAHLPHAVNWPLNLSLHVRSAVARDISVGTWQLETGMANIIQRRRGTYKQVRTAPPETHGLTDGLRLYDGLSGNSRNAGQREQFMNPLSGYLRQENTAPALHRSCHRGRRWPWLSGKDCRPATKFFTASSSERSWCRDVHRYWTTCKAIHSRTTVYLRDGKLPCTSCAPCAIAFWMPEASASEQVSHTWNAWMLRTPQACAKDTKQIPLWPPAKHRDYKCYITSSVATISKATATARRSW